MRKVPPILILAVGFAGCSSSPPMRCSGTEKAGIHELLYFGTGKADGVVTAREWSDFVTAMIVPRFPRGFTVFSATGRWRREDGVSIEESSYVLDVTHAGTPREERAARELMSAYEDRFHQEAVLHVRTAACVSF